jgi:hypothetical protein
MKFYVHAPTKGVPPLGTVMTPSMTRTYAGWSSRGQIYGQPGTRAIPIADPGVHHRSVNDLTSVGSSFSTQSPDVIFPPLYWEAAPPLEKEKFPASVFSDNQMPVPAVRPGNVIKAKPYAPRLGGQRQVYQPQVVQAWRGMKGTPNG